MLTVKLTASALAQEDAAERAAPKGYGLLQQGNIAPGIRQGPLSDAEINDPKVSFCVFRHRWKYLEPRDDQFDFSFLEQQVARYRKAGKPYIIGVMTGGESTPDHVPGKRIRSRKNPILLAPWSPAIPIEFGKLMRALAEVEVAPKLKLRDDPMNVGVWCTGCTVPSQEMHLNGAERAAGFSAPAMLSNWKACFEAVNAAFPETPIILSLSVQRPVQAYQPEVIAYIQQRIGKRAVFQHNSLASKTQAGATHHATLLSLAKQGHVVGAETLGPLGDPMAAIQKFEEASFFVIYPPDRTKLE